jgi:hypothetical protein
MRYVRSYTGLVKAYHRTVAGLVNIPIMLMIQRAIATRKHGLTSFSRKMKFIKVMITIISKTIKEEAGRLPVIRDTPTAVIPQIDDAKLRTKAAVWFKV